MYIYVYCMYMYVYIHIVIIRDDTCCCVSICTFVPVKQVLFALVICAIHPACLHLMRHGSVETATEQGAEKKKEPAPPKKEPPNKEAPQ